MKKNKNPTIWLALFMLGVVVIGLNITALFDWPAKLTINNIGKFRLTLALAMISSFYLATITKGVQLKIAIAEIMLILLFIVLVIIKVFLMGSTPFPEPTEIQTLIPIWL